MDLSREQLAAALQKAIPAIVDSVFGVAGVDPKSLKEAALKIQDSRKATTQQVDGFVGATKYRIVKGYDDNIDVSGTGDPAGIRLFDAGDEGLTTLNGTADLQGITREMVSTYGGRAEVHAFVGGSTGWAIVANGEKVSGFARVDGNAGQVPVNPGV